MNEAALLAVRNQRKRVSQQDFEASIEKIIAGLEKKNRLINPKERNIVACHETGHALIAYLTSDADPVKKITIVPRGMGALGYTMQVPIEDRFLMSEMELLGKIDVLLGGRAAEEIAFGEISTGAANDLVRATEIARRMITEYGMSDRYRHVVFRSNSSPAFLGEIPTQAQREYSEQTQQYIDESVAETSKARYEHVKELLTDRQGLLERVSRALLEKETLDEAEFLRLVEQHGSSEVEMEP